MTTVLKISVMNFNHLAYLWNVGQWGEIPMQKLVELFFLQGWRFYLHKISSAHLR